MVLANFKILEFQRKANPFSNHNQNNNIEFYLRRMGNYKCARTQSITIQNMINMR